MVFRTIISKIKNIILYTCCVPYGVYRHTESLLCSIKSFLGLTKEKIIAGNTNLNNKHCIFASYSPGSVTQDILIQIRWLNKLGYSVTFVSNCNISEKDILSLKTITYKIIIRHENVGYDFGSYKRGIADFMTLSHEKISHLMIMNDSIIFPLSDPTNKFKTMENGPYDFCGLSENERSYSDRYHVQSFCIVFSKKCFSSNVFIKFWEKYRPSSSRRYTIEKGERGLSSVLVKAKFVPGCYYSSDKILNFLNNTSLEEIIKLSIEKLPDNCFKYIRNILNKTTTEFDNKDSATKRKIINSYLTGYNDFNPASGYSIIMRYALDCCFIKKDLVKKRVFDIDFLTSSINSEIIDRDQIEYIYRKKGFYDQLSLWQKILMARGHL